MNIKKIKLGNIDFCYGVKSFSKDKVSVIFASEGEGGKCCIFNEDTVTDTVWENAGGTMSIVPYSDNEFWAVQKFYPGFNSKDAIIVKAKKNNNKWITEELCKLPYVHRFDIINTGNKKWLIACILCKEKESIDDWSSPGYVSIAEIRDDGNLGEFKIILDGLIQNHGYCKQNINNKEVCIIAAQTGVYKLIPSDYYDTWNIEQITNHPTSEASFIDIDNDGIDELVTIEPFHGTDFLIRKLNSKNNYDNIVYRYPEKMNFGHVIWAGKVLGKNTIIGGQRAESRDLFLIQYENGIYKKITIDYNVGPSNIDVIYHNKKTIIASANRENHEASYYIIEGE